MTLDEKRHEVARRMVVAKVYDGENDTSIESEFYGLVYNGCRGVCDWNEPELDEYLSTHDDEGQSTDGD